MSSTRADRGRHPVVGPGYVYAWLCTLATVEGRARGRACWAAGQIGESAHPGQRVSAKDVSAAVGIPMPSVTNLWRRWVRSKHAFGGGQVGGFNAVRTEHRRLMKDRV
jgi:hypothetical protein